VKDVILCFCYRNTVKTTICCLSRLSGVGRAPCTRLKYHDESNWSRKN